jgi:predicted dehydrogenase
MKVAIIGSGFGERVMAPVYREVGFEVVLAHPRDADAVRRACESDVDLVSVHSPPFLHRAHVLQAVGAGHAVLCDKPFGISAHESREMRDSATAAGVLNMLNFEFRSQPSRLKMQQLIREDAIGDLQHLSWTYFGNGFRPRRHAWLFDKDKGGGWIGAYASHGMDTLRWLFDSEIVDCGGVSRIETRTRPDREGTPHPSTAEDAFSAWFSMANGCTAAIDTAYSASVTVPQRMMLMGSAGALELIDESQLLLHRTGQSAETFDFPLPPGDPHRPALIPWLTRVHDAVRTRRQITPSFDDGVAAAEAMDALREKLIPVGPPSG